MEDQAIHRSCFRLPIAIGQALLTTVLKFGKALYYSRRGQVDGRLAAVLWDSDNWTAE